jgi:hypothetical protein
MNLRSAIKHHERQSTQLLMSHQSRKARKEKHRAEVLLKCMKLNREVRAEKRHVQA